MAIDVIVETVKPEFIAAVRVETRIGGIAQAWKPALDQVWAFLRTQPEITRGHNLFLYHHPTSRDAPMLIDFGVQVDGLFEADGVVQCAQTPAGEVACATHVGPYARMGETHNAIHAWCAANGRTIGGASWETYGDWVEDETKLETVVRYLLV